MKKKNNLKRIIEFISVIIVLIFIWDRIPNHIDNEIVDRELKEVLDASSTTPPNMFVTDGCTFWPDSILDYSLTNYCVEHDARYWIGGTEFERLKADEKLRMEVNSTIYGLGDAMYWGLQLQPTIYTLFPSVEWSWRWGYGWNKNGAMKIHFPVPNLKN